MSGPLSTRIAVGFARAVMIIMAVLIVLTGATLLTSPYAIPLTVALWLGAVAIAGLGVCGELPHDA
jgi:hypothetical protein